GAGDASGTDANSDASDATSTDAACVNSVEGASCSTADVSCDSGGDRCCIGYVWACVASSPSGATVWTKEGLGCACLADAAVDTGHADTGSTTFACGPTTCAVNALCADYAPGIRLPDGGTPADYFTCTKFPSACDSTPTCDCVSKHMPTGCTGTCTLDADGHATVHCMGV
ncbi:MAG: hypothetical protein ACHREM_25275, partial [Polyangiales bacterium]